MNGRERTGENRGGDDFYAVRKLTNMLNMGIEPPI